MKWLGVLGVETTTMQTVLSSFLKRIKCNASKTDKLQSHLLSVLEEL